MSASEEKEFRKEQAKGIYEEEPRVHSVYCRPQLRIGSRVATCLTKEVVVMAVYMNSTTKQLFQ